ncbi:MAG: NAD(P)-dependent oxidoreductase [Acidobacteriota bacterium]
MRRASGSRSARERTPLWRSPNRAGQVEESSMKVGFIGLGNMGRPMTENILAAGFSCWVYNRTRSRAEALTEQGARLVDSPAEVAEKSDLVLTCLADVEACRAIFLGPSGLLSATRPRHVLVDHSTVDPATSKEFCRLTRRRGARFLDAPVSGGPEGASQGTLTIMVGGATSAFQRALPVFQTLGRKIVHMGGPGTGSTTKLVNQILVAVHTLASCEAFLLARDSGLEPEKLTAVLMESWGASRMLDRNAVRIAGGDFGLSGAPVRNLLKDLGIIVALAARKGLSLPSTREAERLNRMASDKGMADHDLTAIYQLLAQRAER